jgi:hypothetical protein
MFSSSAPALQHVPAPQPAPAAAHASRPPDRTIVTVWNPPGRYTVRPGDSLSGISRHVYGSTAAWPVLYWANRAQIRWADIIRTGQSLRIPAEPARIPRAPAALHPAPAPRPVVPLQARPLPAPSPGPSAVAPAMVPQAAPELAQGGSAFQRCVIARESGGAPQAMNASGHYGLYQFAAGTWAAYGGNPADFGHASVTEQNQVFSNAIAAGGQSNWAPYDGC